MYPIFKSARQARTRQTAQEQSNSSSARSARCNDGQSSQDLLTQREQQIANLLAAGLTNKQIAREISIAEGTVKVHLHNAYQKRSVSNRLSLALDAERASMAFHAAILPALPGALSSLLFASAAPHLVRADEVLFRVGDAGDGCYRLENGLLKILVTSPEGEELIISFIRPGEMVGELAVIDGLPRSATAVAVTDCELSFISRAVFEKTTETRPELFRCLVNALAARLRETNETLAAASFMNAQARVARALLELAQLLGEDAGEGRIIICHPIRQSDLAAMAGIARENVSRILSDWKRRMIVTRLAQQYCINNPTALKKELEDRPATTARPEERDGAAAAASGSTDCNL